MRKSSSTTIPTLIRQSTLQAVLLAFLVACFLSFIYGFVQHYRQKHQQVQQLADLLAKSASTVDGASLVARQVEMLLDKDSSLSDITFYSSDSPIVAFDQNEIEQGNQDWRNALFTDHISLNKAVTSRYLGSNNYYNPSKTDSRANSPTNSSVIDSTNSIATQEVLVGYINITLDIKQLRLEWLYKNALLLISIILATVASVLFLLRRIKWAGEDITELAKTCEIVVSNPDIEQLPVIQQRFAFEELVAIRLALVTLFNREKTVKRELEALAVFEQQLHNKDLSLNVQRNNFQSMITHELKTSLNAISGGLQLLEGQYISEEQKDTLAIIYRGGQQLEATIEQIIQLNKIEKGQMSINLSEFNPLQLLSELFAEFEGAANQKGLELNSRIHHIDYDIEGDASKIKQVLATLIENAIKFTQSGSVLVESQLTHFNKSIRWEIKVKDTGIGMDNKYLKDIFTPFFQVDPSRSRDYEGVGVGLPVVKQILQLLGASIEVTSEPRVGSQFSVIIPLNNVYQSKSKHSKDSLSDLKIVYYYGDELGVMVEQLRILGATVDGKQHGLLVIEALKSAEIDIVMISQEILPEKAIQLAQMIRVEETHDRVLIIYWYPPHKNHFLDSFEYSLKAAGIDFCYPATQDSKTLYSLLKK